MTPLVVKIGKLIDGATDTECVHTTMQDFLPKASYFRFNPYMSEDILLDETRQEKVYGRWRLVGCVQCDAQKDFHLFQIQCNASKKSFLKPYEVIFHSGHFNIL